MLSSMTGYASQQGAAVIAGRRTLWEWELRAVNGRGLDIRLRLLEGYGFLEKPLRRKLAERLARGSISVSLRLQELRADGADASDDTALVGALQTVARVHALAAAEGVQLRPPTALDVLNCRSLRAADHDFATVDPAKCGALLLADFETGLSALCAARAAEGAALQAVLHDQVEQIAALVTRARACVPDRAAAFRALYAHIVAQFSARAQADPVRLEQELALQAVRADVTEELDRLDAHCATARKLLQDGGPVGRRLDFLTQEFNREGNTLCAKAQYMELTRIGLGLKSVIDQMREQIQNLE